MKCLRVSCCSLFVCLSAGSGQACYSTVGSSRRREYIHLPDREGRVGYVGYGYVGYVDTVGYQCQKVHMWETPGATDILKAEAEADSTQQHQHQQRYESSRSLKGFELKPES